MIKRVIVKKRIKDRILNDLYNERGLTGRY